MHPDLNRVDLRPHPDHDPPPELYTIDGAVPPNVIEARVEWLRRNPANPGDDLTGILERCELEIPEAAARLGVESADLAAVLEGREPVTVDLALRLAAAGWDTAEGWMRWQVDYDIAQERRKRAREAESIDPTTETAPRASAAPYPREARGPSVAPVDARFRSPAAKCACAPGRRRNTPPVRLRLSSRQSS